MQDSPFHNEKQPISPTGQMPIHFREAVLQIFNADFKMPENFTMHEFVIRVGDYDGYIIVETDNPMDIPYLTSILAIFEFKVEPVVDVMDAVSVELKAFEYCKKKTSGAVPMATS